MGGISVGLRAAGFETVAAVEIDPNAARSYVLNFHRDQDAETATRLSAPRSMIEYERIDCCMSGVTGVQSMNRWTLSLAGRRAKLSPGLCGQSSGRLPAIRREVSHTQVFQAVSAFNHVQICQHLGFRVDRPSPVVPRDIVVPRPVGIDVIETHNDPCAAYGGSAALRPSRHCQGLVSAT